MNWIKRAGFIAIPIFAILFSIFFLDFVSFFLLPDNITNFAPNYRSELKPLIKEDLPGYARGYPRGYFQADPDLGFDIAPNKKNMSHIFKDSSYEIFSNEIGCFDKNDLKSIKSSPEYYYFAGDSFIWGYTPYESKLATVYEKKTGRPSLKCGVSHTGQVHQFGKFKKTVEAIGHYPKKVFIGYYINDPVNDYAQPHSTVIDGFLVDTVQMSNGVLAPRDMKQVKNKIDLWLQKNINQEYNNTNDKVDERRKFILEPSRIKRVKEFLRHYSITWHLLNYATNTIKDKFSKKKSALGMDFFYGVFPDIDFKENYSKSDFTKNNREAIIQWAKDAAENSYALTLILIPPRTNFNDQDYFKDMKVFLSKQHIDYLDLNDEFRTKNKTVRDLYWQRDDHLSQSGNEFVGELLAEKYK